MWNTTFKYNAVVVSSCCCVTYNLCHLCFLTIDVIQIVSMIIDLYIYGNSKKCNCMLKEIIFHFSMMCLLLNMFYFMSNCALRLHTLLSSAGKGREWIQDIRNFFLKMVILIVCPIKFYFALILILFWLNFVYSIVFYLGTWTVVTFLNMWIMLVKWSRQETTTKRT
jgi:hypothetical protein